MKIILLSISFFIFSSLYSQGNLQFNQVKNISGTWTSGQTVNNLVVPSGKVVKIESATLSTGGNLATSSAIIFLGNHCIYSGGTNYGMMNLFPFWLSEGSYPINIGYNYSGQLIYSISGIEFNVIP